MLLAAGLAAASLVVIGPGPLSAEARAPDADVHSGTSAERPDSRQVGRESRSSETQTVVGTTAGGDAGDRELLRSGDGPDADSAGIRIGAGLASLLYTPTKVAYAGLGVVVGGLGWVFSGGEGQVASDIMQPSFRGDYLIRPAHLRGTEPIRFVGRRPRSTRQEVASELDLEPEPVPSWEMPESFGEEGDEGSDDEKAVAVVENVGPVLGGPVVVAEDASSEVVRTSAPASAPTPAPAPAPALAPESRSERATPAPANVHAPAPAPVSGSSGEQIRAILSRRDGDMAESAARASGLQALPAVSAPPPTRRTEGVEGATEVAPMSETGSTDRSARADRGRWEIHEDVPDRAREDALKDVPDGGAADAGWPQPQVDSMRWTKDTRGVWVYEAP